MISLNVTDLKKRFGSKWVFQGITFTVGPVILGIAGANGSGKSTLLKCLSGLMKPTSGTIEWKIKNETLPPKKIKRSLGFVAPYIQLYEELTVRENLQFITDLKRDNNPEGIDDLIHRFKLSPLIHVPFGNLSTGQQQRVKLAAAVLHKPQVLILDEPGSNLDSRGKQVIEHLVAEYRKKDSMVLLASNQSHELDLCDEVFDLNHQETVDS